ncbi:unnamed protein product [Vitrella brassicaformis CCMP3155]|uniref:Ketoreductase domain-containing protein n=1 Tax=Vitrella brassicaformis (strain CCMP3155) TaxID=1169540 RepID=A0A0G4ES52_VITBC|nr:unnamed protein product [Vitrella brassicaformis CCMP3155]|eukprot:CEM00874.1 unnamed protein product [Vitrella brassicaformis CCMP3155]
MHLVLRLLSVASLSSHRLPVSAFRLYSSPLTMSAAAANAEQGKIYLITGSTDGIGRHTAHRLAAANKDNTVIIHGRSPERLEAAKAELVRATKNINIFAYLADLSVMRNVEALASEIKKHHPRIDVLINNAGVFEERRQETPDAMELTFAVNVAAPYVLTRHLLDCIPDNTGRIIITSSISQGSRIDLNNLQLNTGYSDHAAYSLSKLCDVLLTVEIADRLKSRGIVCHTQDPGTVNTKMLLAGWGPCGIDVSVADNTFWLATSNDPHVVKETGNYFVSRRLSTPSGPAGDGSVRAAFWAQMEQLTGVKYP